MPIDWHGIIEIVEDGLFVHHGSLETVKLLQIAEGAWTDQTLALTFVGKLFD